MQIDIPKQFRVRVVDDAMAPLAPAGTICTFAVQAPTVGDGVLVRDASGDLHFRQYRQRVGGGFEARPLNDAYSWLDSAEHDLTVVAVFTGISASLSQLLRAR
ncbi:MAG: hypothetical protein L6Q68_03120 [Aquabacterium sp.]|nr:hypothetical protein [Aquabacterium sp.]